MKKCTLICRVIGLVLLLHPTISSAQTSLIRFQKVFGRSQSDLLNGIKSLSDGGYLLAGSTQTVDTASGLTRQDILVIKTDSAGNIKWSNLYGSSATEAAFSIEEGNHGYYIFGNTIDSATNVSSADLLHIDTAGHVIWNKTYAMYTNEWGAVIKKLNGNAYMLCGKTYNAITDYEIFLLKIDSAGNVIWGRGYNGDAGMTDVAHALTFTADGGFLIAGDSYFIPTHHYFVLGIKTDSTGNPEWIRTYADTHNSRGEGAYEVAGDGYIFGGQMVGATTAADMLLIRTDNTGNVIWSKTYGGTGIDFAHTMVPLDSGYAIIGESNSFFSTGATNAYVVRTDTGGNLLSSFTYGDTTAYSAGVCALKTPHNGLAIGGISIGYGPGLEDFYFIKTLGDSTGCFESAVSTTVTDIALSPNSFLNVDTLSAVVTDITATLQTGLNGLDVMSDSTLCFSLTVIPADTTIDTTTYIHAPLAFGSKVYPNPSHGNFTIQSVTAVAVTSVRILNDLGIDVTGEFTIRISGSTVYLGSKNMIPGHYWIRTLDKAGNAAIYRVLIQ